MGVHVQTHTGKYCVCIEKHARRDIARSQQMHIRKQARESVCTHQYTHIDAHTSMSTHTRNPKPLPSFLLMHDLQTRSHCHHICFNYKFSVIHFMGGGKQFHKLKLANRKEMIEQKVSEEERKKWEVREQGGRNESPPGVQLLKDEEVYRAEIICFSVFTILVVP